MTNNNKKPDELKKILKTFVLIILVLFLLLFYLDCNYKKNQSKIMIDNQLTEEVKFNLKNYLQNHNKNIKCYKINIIGESNHSLYTMDLLIRDNGVLELKDKNIMIKADYVIYEISLEDYIKNNYKELIKKYNKK